MKDSFKLSCDLVRCPDTSFLKLIPNDRETKMAVVVGGAGGGGELCCIEYGYLGPAGTPPLKTSRNASPGKYTNCLDSW